MHNMIHFSQPWMSHMCHHEAKTLFSAACPASNKSITQPAAASQRASPGLRTPSAQTRPAAESGHHPARGRWPYICMVSPAGPFRALWKFYSSRAARQPQPSHLCGFKAPLVMSFVLSCKVATDRQVQFTIKCTCASIMRTRARPHGGML